MILDTNALSAFIDGEVGVGRELVQAPRVAIPVIVLGEFLYGISQSRHRKTYERWLSANLGSFELLQVSPLTAQSYATLRLAIKKIGRPIPANDAWIAALCLEHKLPILSRDGHFDFVPGLTRIGW